MTTTLRRIEPVSLAKIYAVVTGALLLAVAIPAGCGLAVFGSAIGESSGMGIGLIGLLVVFLYPIIGAVMGFVAGFLYAAVYNIVADRMGGVELEFDEPLTDGVVF